MRSYLSLIPISAKVNRRKNRMTILCIVIAVFLVTSVFSLVDMFVQAEQIRLINSHGNWHAALTGVSANDAAEVASRPDVAAMSRYAILNQDAESDYSIEGQKLTLVGSDEEYITKIRDCLSEGTVPETEDEIMLSGNAKKRLGIKLGDKVKVKTPGAAFTYTVTAFGSDDEDYYDSQQYLVAGFVNMKAFQKICDHNTDADASPLYYVQFRSASKAQKIIKELKTTYGWNDENITENSTLLALSLTSSNSEIMPFYSIAGVLFVAILIAGVLMISGSINSDVAQRTRFFGMLRCVGMSRQQIIRYVRLEALNWCKTAIPLGLILGILTSWVLCALLRFKIGGEFSTMPLFGVSAIGILFGVLIGIVSVFLSARAPAKRAAKVSPVMAVSGNTESSEHIRRPVNLHSSKIDTALGIHHAVTEKKNFLLMTGSFAFSIILILSFCAIFDFGAALMPSLKSWQPDLTITGQKNECSVDRSLVDKISKMDGVAHVFGNTYASDIPARTPYKDTNKINIVSYDDYMLDCAKDSRIDGDISKAYGDSDGVLTIFNKENPLRTGDKIQVNGEEIEVVASLDDGLFADGLIVICSEETYERLLGKSDYSMVSIQLTSSATDTQAEAVLNLTGNNQISADYRKTNRDANAEYYASRLLMYGFLAIISMITILHILNSISMSVSARQKQYGAMRAVGMSGEQLTKMIAAEVLTYTLAGCLIGGAAGLFLNRFIYIKSVTEHMGTLWSVPIAELIIILLMVSLSAVMAVHIPSKRVRSMPVTEAINEL